MASTGEPLQPTMGPLDPHGMPTLGPLDPHGPPAPSPSRWRGGVLAPPLHRDGEGAGGWGLLRSLLPVLPTVALLVGVLALWELAVWAWRLPVFLLPRPSAHMAPTRR